MTIIKNSIRHAIAVPMFLLTLLYSCFKSIPSWESIKLMLKNTFTSIITLSHLGSSLGVYSDPIIYKGKNLIINLSFFRFNPFFSNPLLEIEICPLAGFKTNRTPHGLWAIHLGKYAKIPWYKAFYFFKRRNLTIDVQFPKLVYKHSHFNSISDSVSSNMLDTAKLENGKYIGFLRIRYNKSRYLCITKLFKFYNFNRYIKKVEKAALDQGNKSTYNFLFSKPFSKNYENFASVWNETDKFAHIQNFGIYAFNFISIIARLRLSPGAIILDLGSGSCWTSEWFSKLGYNVVAYDISLQTLSIGNDRISNYKNSCNFPQVDIITPDFITVCGDSTVLPFMDDSFDAVILIETLHHVPEYISVIKEAYRTLKVNGKLIILEPGYYHSETEEALFTMKNQAVLEASLHRKNLRRIAKATGFSIKEYMMPINTYVLPRSDPYYYKGYICRLYGNVYDWYIRLLKIGPNMNGNIFFVMEKI